MKHRFLWACGGFFHGLGTLFFVPTIVPFALVQQRRLSWPFALLLSPLALLFYALYSCTQIPGSLCVYILQQKISTRAFIQANGLRLQAESLPSSHFIAWNDIAFIRRVYERLFPGYEVRFRDAPAYRMILKSREIIFVDLVDEAVLETQALEHGISLAGFEQPEAARRFESRVPGPLLRTTSKYFDPPCDTAGCGFSPAFSTP